MSIMGKVLLLDRYLLSFESFAVDFVPPTESGFCNINVSRSRKEYQKSTKGMQLNSAVYAVLRTLPGFRIHIR